MLLHRPILRWLLFAACVALFVAAMAWVTQRMCAMDRDHQAAERDAQLQERVRLALWRMDSLVNTLLVRENSRPPSHYQPFHSPEDLFSNRSQTELPKGEAVMPSPLLGEAPEFVNLHFQLMQQGTMCNSPQVPTGRDLTLANNWYAISPQLDLAKQRLTRLDAILRKHPAFMPALNDAPPAPTASPPKAAEPVLPSANKAMTADTAAVAPTNVEQKMARSQVDANFNEYQQRSKVAMESNSSKDNFALNNLPLKKKEDLKPQTRAYAAAPSATAAATKNSSSSLSVGRKNSASGGAAAPASPPVAAAPAPAAEGSVALAIPLLSPAPAPKPADRADQPVSRAAAVADQAAAVSTPASAPSDLKPQWIENELFLLRTATLDGSSRVQGLWLDWPKLRARLIDTIHDLLPNAELSATDPAWLDASSLVTLPVRLLPGQIHVAAIEASPLHRSLIIAWACFIIAAVAVGIVLNRAILLSERRGAFVSAVTHELRTPLTTFQLYSEMLADDMVPDANKRREYLRTLCDESTRLTHLVENVLSYSRIERGRAAARRENVLLSDFITRIEPRLRQRTQQTGLDLQVSITADAAETRINVDALAVEQIVFNLVDNACKYAAPASTERVLHLEVNVEPSQAVIRVRDHGPGLSKQQLKRLFRPFEKSATEAAHSAPGVGLGLALCRRLARELRGDLVLESRDNGACFRLTVPVSA